VTKCHQNNAIFILGNAFSKVTFKDLKMLRASEGTLSRWSRLYLQSLAPINQHWACAVGYGPFCLWVIHKEGLCPNSGGINRFMTMMKILNVFF
jgi:hypothetical protein